MSNAEQTKTTKAQQVIGDCTEAYKLCIETAAYCAAEGGELARPNVLQALHDCADLSLAVVNFLARASHYHRALAEMHIHVANACADVLRPLEHNDPQLRATFAACRRAAEACAELTGKAATEKEDAWDETVQESFPASDPPPPPTEL